MQIFGFVAVIALVGLMSISGFQIVPESMTNQAAANNGSALDLTPTLPAINSNSRSAANSNSNSGNQTAPPVPVFSPAAITGEAAQNIEASTALLRGVVTVGSETLGDVFFIYGYDKADIDRSIASHTTYEAVLANKRTEAEVARVTRSLTKDRDVSTRVSNLAPDSTYYVRLCAERTGQLMCSRTITFTTTPGAYSAGEVRIPTIRVTNESVAAADEMSLAMTIAMRDTMDGEVYLVYGESQSQVTAAINQPYSRIDENDEQLQKSRIVRDIRGTQRLVEMVDDLTEDTLIYYFICVEYDGLRDGTVCSRVQTYRTHNEDFGKAPRVQTTAAVANKDTARLAGSVRMSGFNDGKVFFIYGSDLQRITRASGETSMERLRQIQDRFQRILVDSDLDGNDSFALTVRDLQSDTLYAARLCVEYENQNKNYRDSAFVECGELRSFVTE